MKTLIAIAILAALLGGCAKRQQQPQRQMTADEAECYVDAKKAGAAVSNQSLVWQMVIQGQTEKDVFAACMRAKQLRAATR